MRRSLVSGVVAYVVVAFGSLAEGADKVYVGMPGMEDWLDDDNWQPAGIPTAEDDVTIGNGRAANLSSDTAIRKFTLDGFLDDVGSLLVHGRMTWKGGFMRNTVSGVSTTTLEAGMDVVFPPTGARQVLDRTLILAGGTSTLHGPEGFGLGGNATLELEDDAVLEAVEDAGGLQYIVAAPGVFNIHGIFRKTAGNTGTTRLENIEVNNFGRVEVLSGRMEMNATGNTHAGAEFTVADGATLHLAGNYHLLAGSKLTGAGEVQIGGNVDFLGVYDVGSTVVLAGEAIFATDAKTNDLRLEEGNLGGTGTFTVADSFVWTGGFMLGTGVTNVENGMDLSGGLKQIEQRTVNLNGGIATLSGFGSRFRFTNATFNNKALFQVTGAGGNNRFQGSGTFSNSGTFRALSAINVDGVQFLNSGFVEVGNGTFITMSGGYTQSAGMTRLQPSSTLASFGVQPLHFDGGILEGSGTVQANVSSAARVRPGLSAGRLFVAGNYAQMPGGRLDIEIGGLTPYSEYDALEATGDIALDGLLEVKRINGFLPSMGDVFTIVLGASRSGQFAATEGLVIGQGLGFAVRLGGRDVKLEVVFEDCNSNADLDGDGNAGCADEKCAGASACGSGATPTRTPTASRTPTPTSTFSGSTATRTPTSTPSRSPTPTSTRDPSLPTFTPTSTATPTRTPTPTSTRDPSLPTFTPTSTATPTRTPTPTSTSAPTRTFTSSVPTPTRTETYTPGPSPTPTSTRDPSLPTLTPTSTASVTPSPTPTATPTPIVCRGDCNDDDQTTVDEIIRVVDRALHGQPAPPGCLPSGGDPVLIEDILDAVSSALGDCR